MAPTEILAEQHYRKLVSWLEPLGVEVAWLTGSLKGKDGGACWRRSAAGEAQLVVGTHALIEDKVEFAPLGLAIVDEQHRFGVRSAWRCARRPSAAARAAPADDVGHAHPAHAGHELLRRPRRRCSTSCRRAARRSSPSWSPGQARRGGRARARRGAAGRQAYWVCPLIEESEDAAT
jgi:ATP-dependent DNA helicase RecG